MAAKTKTMPYDVAAQLRTPKEVTAYLNAWLSDFPEDTTGFIRALGEIVKAKGITRITKESGLTRASLSRALGKNGKPSFITVVKVMRALGLRLRVAPM